MKLFYILSLGLVFNSQAVRDAQNSVSSINTESGSTDYARFRGSTESQKIQLDLNYYANLELNQGTRSKNDIIRLLASMAQVMFYDSSSPVARIALRGKETLDLIKFIISIEEKAQKKKTWGVSNDKYREFLGSQEGRILDLQLRVNANSTNPRIEFLASSTHAIFDDATNSVDEIIIATKKTFALIEFIKTIEEFKAKESSRAIKIEDPNEKSQQMLEKLLDDVNEISKLRKAQQ
jgi:hypothetical protein